MEHDLPYYHNHTTFAAPLHIQIQMYFMSSPECLTPEDCVILKLFEYPVPITPAKSDSYFKINSKEKFG